MPEGPLFDYRARVANRALKPDPAQELLAEKLQSLHRALAGYTPAAGGAGWNGRLWCSARGRQPRPGRCSI